MTVADMFRRTPVAPCWVCVQTGMVVAGDGPDGSRGPMCDYHVEKTRVVAFEQGHLHLEDEASTAISPTPDLASKAAVFVPGATRRLGIDLTGVWA